MIGVCHLYRSGLRVDVRCCVLFSASMIGDLVGLVPCLAMEQIVLSVRSSGNKTICRFTAQTLCKWCQNGTGCSSARGGHNFRFGSVERSQTAPNRVLFWEVLPSIIELATLGHFVWPCPLADDHLDERHGVSYYLTHSLTSSAIPRSVFGGLKDVSPPQCSTSLAILRR